MKNKILFIFILGLLFLFFPKVYANELCSSNGYTILTINGILTDRDGAIENRDKLARDFNDTFNNQPLTVDYVLNPTHGAIIDSLDSVLQKYFDQNNFDAVDSDFAQMLTEASNKVTTQKLLLVGHSQGNFYANTFYDTVVDETGGVPSESIGVYAVATPATTVEGGGSYLTSDTDKMIAGIVPQFPFTHILKPNAHIDFNVSDGDMLGHDFSKIYLKYEGAKIVSDIQSSLNKLKNNNVQDENSLCINPPKLTLMQKIKGTVLSIFDHITIPTQNALVYAVSGTVNTAFAIGNTAVNLTSSAISVVASLFTSTTSNAIDLATNNSSADAILSQTKISQNSSDNNTNIQNNSAKNNPTQNTTIKNSQSVLQPTTPINIPTKNSLPTTAVATISAPLGFSSVGKGGGGEKNIVLTEDNDDTNDTNSSDTDTVSVVPPVYNPTYVTDYDITADTTWDLAGSPYIIENGIEVEPGFTLTIKPGVVVKFSQDVGLSIFGSLIANGDADNQIYFTSTDDVVGGNTWQGISFLNAGDSSITNATFKYASSIFYSRYSSITLKNIKINDSGDGITVNNSVLNADGVDCVGLVGACLTGYDHSTINWKNSTIDYGGVTTDDSMNDAIDIYDSSTLNISNTSINFNNEFFSTIAVFLNSSITADHIKIQGSTSSWVFSPIEVYINSNLTLTNSSISSIGGSSSLMAYENSTVSVDNTEINSNLGDNGYVIYVFNNTNFTLKNSSIKNSDSLAESAIITFDFPEYAPSVLTIGKTVFEGGASAGIFFWGNQNISVIDSIFKNFTDFAIQNLGTSVINAENNFWNDKTGPHNSTSNPNGLGEEVSDNVLFAPWCADETCTPSIPPVISSLSLSSSTDTMKIGDIITLSIVADSAGYTDKNISINNVPITNFTDNGDGTYTVLYTVSAGDGDAVAGSVPVSVVLVNAFGNSNVADTTVEENTLAIDATAQN